MPEVSNVETNDFVFHNSFTVCGKIVFKRPIKNGNLFALSIARNTRKKDEKGRPIKAYRMVDVHFEGATGKFYDKQFETGDFVIIGGVTQKVRNFYLARDMVKLVGLTMAPKIIGRYENHDSNRVNIRGRITKSAAVNDELVICNLFTNVHRKFRNPNPEGTIEFFEDDFISETPVAIWRTREGEHDAKAFVTQLTKGTWLDVSGFIDTKKMELRDGRTFTEQRLIARDIYVVGDIQVENHKEEPREKIIIPMNYEKEV